MLRRKREVFAPTDGWLALMEEDAARSERGIDFSGTKGLRQRLRLDYRSARLRSQDVELAEATGAELTRRVQVRDAPGLSTDLLALVGGTLYEVTRVDRASKTAHLWLAEIAVDGTCVLLDDTVTVDEWAVGRAQGAPATVFVRRASPGAARESSLGADALQPTITVRLRACDYRGELALARGSVTYSVTSVAGHGRWVDLRCELREGNRGQ